MEKKDGFNSEAGLLGEAWKLPGLSILWRLPGLQDRHPSLTCASRCKGAFMCMSPELTPTPSWGGGYLSGVHITRAHSSEMVMHFSRAARPCSCCRHATLSPSASKQPRFRYKNKQVWDRWHLLQRRESGLVEILCVILGAPHQKA